MQFHCRLIHVFADLIPDVLFDHRAAESACSALTVAAAFVEQAAADRAAIVEDVLCRCNGPFVEQLRHLVSVASREAAGLREDLLTARGAIIDAAEAARAEQRRREAQREELLALAAQMSAASAAAPSDGSLIPALPA